MWLPVCLCLSHHMWPTSSKTPAQCSHFYFLHAKESSPAVDQLGEGTVWMQTYPAWGTRVDVTAMVLFTSFKYSGLMSHVQVQLRIS